MAKNKYSPSETKYKRWIKEGRGNGHGIDYLPWITVRDIPSDGRSHRVFGHKSQRTHHLLSDLELAVFLTLEWRSDTKDIREQFPLERQDTLNIALDNGIKHPTQAGVNLYMSSDFVIDSSDPSRQQYVIQAKYSQFLADPRVIEKLEIERRYWRLKKIPWFLVTELNVSPILTQNISWLYPAERDEIDDDVLLERTAFYGELFLQNPTRAVTDICKQLDSSYNQPVGSSIYEIRQLLANRCFYFDMSQPFHLLKGQDFMVENMGNLIGSRDVSNQ
ncbi:TnsA endonuclease N-terminal domain-containing protein [Vibrio aquimaris]|uniref:Transposon Tn7 transposition protein TnsA n=1 Tax=Vibrio aquimaris TaxID=2587862 RepID=A0A5P9CHS3_9VIBR|nr:TnsA endonuclease N-terminal domain-containing protein [Vibrio aquimaris]QFT25237.1 Transposon Tn7 transposition protein TnsA [Vibrio aquimaris]